MFGRSLRLLPYFMCANSVGSGEKARMLVAFMISTIISWAGSDVPCFVMFLSGFLIWTMATILFCFVKKNNALYTTIKCWLLGKVVLNVRKDNWARPWETVSYDICEQQRRRSTCASAQSDQHLCCSLPRQNDTSSLYIRNFKIPAGLCSWTGQFVPCLVVHGVAHIKSKLYCKIF